MLFKTLEKYYIILGVDYNGVPFTLKNDLGFIIFYEDLKTAKKILKTLNRGELAKYYIEKIKN